MTSSYEITPLAALHHVSAPCALATSNYFRHLLTGCTDGRIYKWDFFAIMNSKNSLPQNQRSAYVDSVVKAGPPINYYFNEDRLRSDRLSTVDGMDWTHAVLDEEEHVDVSPVYALTMHSEAIWALSGTRSGNINLFTTRHDEGTIVHTLRKHKNVVSVLQLSNDEQSVLSGSWDTAIYDWDLNTGLVKDEFISHKSHISCICRHPTDPHSFMSTAINGVVLIWDTRQSTKPVQEFALSEKTPPWALSACWNRTGSQVIVGRRNNTVDLYDVNSTAAPQRILSVPRASGTVSALHMLPNDRSLLVGSTDNIRLWDLQHELNGKRGVPFTIVPGHHSGLLSALAVDDSAKFMITTSGNSGYEGPETLQCLLYKMEAVMA